MTIHYRQPNASTFTKLQARGRAMSLVQRIYMYMYLHTLKDTAMETFWFTICTASMEREVLVLLTSGAGGGGGWNLILYAQTGLLLVTPLHSIS